MRAFHNDPEKKAQALLRLRAHIEGNDLRQELERGFYNNSGIGNAIGCIVHSEHATDFETQLGIPVTLAYLQNAIFEALPPLEALKIPEYFLARIEVGDDLSNIWAQFAAWLLADPEEGVIRFARTDDVAIAITNVAKLYSDGCTDQQTWRLAEERCLAACELATAAKNASVAGGGFQKHPDPWLMERYYAASTVLAASRVGLKRLTWVNEVATGAAHAVLAGTGFLRNEAAKDEALMRQFTKLLELLLEA